MASAEAAAAASLPRLFARTSCTNVRSESTPSFPPLLETGADADAAGPGAKKRERAPPPREDADAVEAPADPPPLKNADVPAGSILTRSCRGVVGMLRNVSSKMYMRGGYLFFDRILQAKTCLSNSRSCARGRWRRDSPGR